MELHERLAVFFQRLAAAPPANSATEALALVCRLIEEVENEFSPIPRSDPPPRRATGRMYPPLADYIFSEPGGSLRAETRRHTMRFAADGSIRIALRENPSIAFSKPGRTL